MKETLKLALEMVQTKMYAHAEMYLKEALAQLAQKDCGCAECGKKEKDGWYLYCVECMNKATLAQPEKEPVAWMVYTQDGQSVYVTDNPTDIQEGQRALPMYTTPPQRKPEQELYSELLFAVGKKYPNETRHQTALRYIQQAEICAVEQSKAAHGIKETTE